MKARLEEIAYHFQKTGEEVRALIALSAARSMEEKGLLSVTNHFLRHLIERSLEIYLEAASNALKEGSEKSQEEPASRIILPR